MIYNGSKPLPTSPPLLLSARDKLTSSGGAAGCPSDAENGALCYIAGSHKRGLVPHTNALKNIDETQLDLASERVADVRRGGVVFHQGACLHCSRENRSERWRRSYATHWVSQRATTTSAKTLEAPIFETQEWRQGWGWQVTITAPR